MGISLREIGFRQALGEMTVMPKNDSQISKKGEPAIPGYSSLPPAFAKGIRFQTQQGVFAYPCLIMPEDLW